MVIIITLSSVRTSLQTLKDQQNQNTDTQLLQCSNQISTFDQLRFIIALNQQHMLKTLRTQAETLQCCANLTLVC